jgi:Fe-S-cluster-containing hydrogenase component 2
MVPDRHRIYEAPDHTNPARTVAIAQPKAATCDLCDSANNRSTPAPACVSSCPHDAAHRLTGEQILQRVLHGAAKKR